MRPGVKPIATGARNGAQQLQTRDLTKAPAWQDHSQRRSVMTGKVKAAESPAAAKSAGAGQLT